MKCRLSQREEELRNFSRLLHRLESNDAWSLPGGKDRFNLPSQYVARHHHSNKWNILHSVF